MVGAWIRRQREGELRTTQTFSLIQGLSHKDGVGRFSSCCNNQHFCAYVPDNSRVVWRVLTSSRSLVHNKPPDRCDDEADEAAAGTKDDCNLLPGNQAGVNLS